MRVFFYTGGFTHTFYKEQVHALPPNVEIIGLSDDRAVAGMKSDIAKSASFGYRAVRRLKHGLLRLAVAAHAPNVRYVSAPPCDLIHSAQYPLLNGTPWVMDFEDASVFAWYDPASLAHSRVRSSLQRLF